MFGNLVSQGAGATLSAVMSPFTSIFSTTKKIITLIIVLAIVCIGGYMWYKYSSTIERERGNTISVLTNAADNNAVTATAAVESGVILQQTLEINTEAKKDVVKETKKKREKTTDDLTQVRLKFDTAMAKPNLDAFAKADLQRQREKEVSTVVIASVWDNYCDAVKASDESLIKTCS